MKIMHCDMSPRNILLFAHIDDEGNVFAMGMLIDWDLCEDRKYLGTAMSVGRSVSLARDSVRQTTDRYHW